MDEMINLMPAVENLGKAVEGLKAMLQRSLQPPIVFPPGSVPTKVASRVYGKDGNWIHAGIIAGWLPIGTATRKGKEILDVQEMDSKKGKITYYISPKKLYEDTGYIWRGEKE